MKFLKKEYKIFIATIIAIVFHVIGFVGILFFNKEFFIKTTAYNLLLMFVLVIWTQTSKNLQFFIFIFCCVFVGIGVEIFGVNTALLFGKYHYGEVLGFKINSVPIIIGVNWFLIIYCIGISITMILSKLSQKLIGQTPANLTALSIVIDGASLAVFFDWIMEPVAVKLGFWYWYDGEIPFFNYFSWFFVSIILLLLFHYCKFQKQNKFAVNLLLIQFMFFLLLRTFN